MTDVAAIILAAGESRRFRAAAGPAGPATKLVANYDGEPMARRVAACALASSARPVVLVTGHARADVEAAVAGLGILRVHNPGYATGLASSLAAGIAALPPDAAGAVVLLGDMPRVTPAIVERLIEAFRANPGVHAVVPAFNGQRGNPVLLARALFGEAAKLTGDAGARKLLGASNGDVLEIAFADAAITFDVDTPRALED